MAKNVDIDFEDSSLPIGNGYVLRQCQVHGCECDHTLDRIGGGVPKTFRGSSLDSENGDLFGDYCSAIYMILEMGAVPY